jgi:hypothetical protein
MNCQIRPGLPRDRDTLVLPASLLIAGFALTGERQTGPDGLFPLWLFISSAALLFAPLAARYHNRKFPDPLWLIAGLHLVYFVARAAGLRYGSSYTHYALESEQAFATYGQSVLRLVALAGCAIYWGTLIPQPKRLIAAHSQFVARPLQSDDVQSWLLMGLVGVLFRLGLDFYGGVWQFGLESSVGLVFFLAMDAGLEATIAAYTFATEPQHKGYATLLLAGIIVSLYFFNFKEPLIMTLLLLLAGRVMLKRKVPWLSIACAALFTLFVVFPLVQGRREAAIRQEPFRLEYFTSHLTGGKPMDGAADLIAKAVGQVLVRFHGADSFAIVLNRVPSEIPHPGVSGTLSRFAISFLPRFLFPDKPLIHQGFVFNEIFFGRLTQNVSIATFQIVEAYYLAGIAGLIFIGMFMGWAGSFIGYLRSEIDSPLLFPYFCIFIRTLMNTERDIVLVWTTLLRALFVFWLLHAGLKYLFGRFRANAYQLCAASPDITIKAPSGVGD